MKEIPHTKLILTNRIMSYIRKIYRFFLLAVMIISAACQRYEDIYSEQAATISIKVSIPDIELETKNVSSSPSDPSSWTAWERAVDGRYLYRVTAFLIQGDRLVASKDLELTGEPTSAKVEFEGNFTHGTYRIMAVANYSAHQADDGENGVQTYEGLTDFSTIVNNLIGQTNVADFTTDYEESFLKYQIASNGGICPKVPQVLSMVKDIELHPGENIIEGELIRTYSRIRITIENHSDEDLKLSSLSFDNIFAQKKAYLFPENGYIQDKTALDFDSEDALTPFTATSENPLTIPGKGTATIFDAYILESQKESGEEYNYLLGLGYDGAGDFTLGSTSEIRRQDDVSSGYYLIYNTSSSRYLMAGTNSVSSGTMSGLTEGMKISEEFVWCFDKRGLVSDNYYYYIGTAQAMSTGQTAYYMNSPSNTNVTLTSEKNGSFYIGETYSYSYYYRVYYLTLRGSGGRYLRVEDDDTVSGRNGVNISTYFILYPVVPPSASSSVQEIQLQTIDNRTGQAVEVNEIKRNDFINTVITVKYNKNKGHFQFEVKDWSTGGGNVEFN